MRTPWERSRERRANEAATRCETAQWLEEVMAESEDRTDATVQVFAAVSTGPGLTGSPAT